MKIDRILLVLILSLFFTSCSDSDEGGKEEASYDFTIRNVYLKIVVDAQPDYGQPDCWADLVVTDGSFTEMENEYLPNEDIKNIIFFNDIRVPNCEYEYPVEFNWDMTNNENQNMGMEPPNPLFDVIIIDGNATVQRDFTHNVIKSSLIFTSSSSFKYRIELDNGQILEKSYNGVINLIDNNKRMGL